MRAAPPARGAVSLALLLCIALGRAAPLAAEDTTAATSPATPATVTIDALRWTLEAHPGPLAEDYVALAESSISPSDPFALERGVDEGLVEIATGEPRRVERYRIEGERVRVQVRVRAETTAPDWLDLVVTDDARGVVVVRTVTTNAGFFTVSTVWELGPLATLDDALDAWPWPDTERALLEAALGSL